MTSALQQWCEDSLEWVRRHSPENSETYPTTDRRIGDERIVETAAFLKLAQLRKCPVLKTFAGRDLCRLSIESMSAMIDSCPFDQTSAIETLGSIHESFVASRDLSSSSSSRRRSVTRKTGGVFYTPKPVVEYIVCQTVGRLIEGMCPQQVESVKILDPAAGSGAFLLATYRFLLDWYLRWYLDHSPKSWPADLVMTGRDWQLSPQRRASILANNLYGVDLDATAIEVTRRTLWLAQLENTDANIETNLTVSPDHLLLSNLKQGNALIGPAFGDSDTVVVTTASASPFVWAKEFPQICRHGGFDVVLGNPPYRRERNFKQQLDEIGATSLGRYHSPRMDLWYYFVHRGIQLLRPGGRLSFITSAYWTNGTGADKLIAALRDEVHLDELLLLNDHSVFSGVSGQHLIFRLTKTPSDFVTTIKVAPQDEALSLQAIFADKSSLRTFTKTQDQLFQKNRMDVCPPSDGFLMKLGQYPRLIELGIVRQGIAENPATINQRTLDRFHDEPSSSGWCLNEGVFSLQVREVEQLKLLPRESQLLRPYHDLCDLGRYWSAKSPSRQLIYSTRKTCPEIAEYPHLEKHLERFRAILDVRRETRAGSNCWWHLHWPRDERIWRAPKIIAVQMAARPSFVPATKPTYVSFSANVFVPAAETQENLKYLCGLLNSRVLWAWFAHHAKRRGVGLELNGHVLEQAPIRRIDFQNPEEVKQHDDLVSLVDLRIRLERKQIERPTRKSSKVIHEIQTCETQIDQLVASLYQLDLADLELGFERPMA